MSRPLDARDLRLIDAIAAGGSLAAAARVLHVSQPTASEHLAALELRMGARLVDRGPRGAQLTELGMLVREHARDVLARLERAEADVARHVEYGVSTLRLGTFPSAGADLVARAAAELIDSGLHVVLVEAEVPQQLEALAARSVHAAVIFRNPEDPPIALDGVLQERLLDDEHLVLLPAGHPAAAQARVALADLRGEPWIAAPEDDDPSYVKLLDACRREGFEPVFASRIDSFQMTQGLVAAGLGISLLPRLALNPLRDDVVVRPLAGARVVREVGVAMLSTVAPHLRERLLTALRGAVPQALPLAVA
jgi:DNA-binding transcriptional LysR family regulator